MMIAHEAIDRAEAASQFKSVNQLFGTRDRDLHARGADKPHIGTKREAFCAMPNELAKTFRLESPTKDKHREVSHGTSAWTAACYLRNQSSFHPALAL
jgi:hypothetical protein